MDLGKRRAGVDLEISVTYRPLLVTVTLIMSILGLFGCSKKVDLDEKKAKADRVWRNRFDIVLADFHSQDDVLKANAKLTEMSQAIAEQSVGFHFHAHWTS